MPATMADKSPRTRMLMVRVSDEEGKALDAAARELGLPTGTWLRSLGLQEAAKMRKRAEKG